MIVEGRWKTSSSMVKLPLDNGVNIDSTEDDGRTAISLAAMQSGYYSGEVVNALLDVGADMESKDNDGRAPLSLAVLNGPPALVELLLKHGANRESGDNHGRIALSLAATKNNDDSVPVVKLLLDAGVDKESKDNDGRTPLSQATWEGYSYVIEFLFKRRGHIQSKDKFGRSFLSFSSAVFSGISDFESICSFFG